MKVLLAAGGSKFTKKALAFLVTHESLAGPEGEQRKVVLAKPYGFLP
jgi:hypothetical protein